MKADGCKADLRSQPKRVPRMKLLVLMTVLVVQSSFSWAEEAEPTVDWQWVPSFLPRAFVIEGLWTDTFRLRESVRPVGMPCAGAYRATKGVRGMLSHEAYREYSVIVLSNVDAPAIGDGHLLAIRQFVEAGGGLVVLGGYWAFGRGGYHGTPLAEMLPVKFDERGAIAASQKGWVLKPAASTDWMKGCDFSARPGAFHIHKVKAKPQATVHITAGEHPVVVSWAFGRGRVMAFALTVNGEPKADGLPFWEWRGWPKLLGQAVEWAAKGRPLHSEKAAAKAVSVPPGADYLEILTGERKDAAALRQLCENMTSATAKDFFDAWKENPDRFAGEELPALFEAMFPFAQSDWSAPLIDFLSGAVVNVSHRKAALVLLGATAHKDGMENLQNALSKMELASGASRGLGLSKNPKAIAPLKRAYKEAMQRSMSREHPTRVDPEAFAGDNADTAAECCLALYRLGSAGAVEGLAQIYARLHFYRRIFRNSCKQKKWDDKVKHRWAQGKRLEVALKHLQRSAGPIPESQFSAFVKFAQSVTDPIKAEWARLAMEQSVHEVEADEWRPLHAAKDGVIARLARQLSTLQLQRRNK